MMSNGGKLFRWSRYHVFTLILLLTVVLFYYNSNTMEMVNDWNPRWRWQHDPPKDRTRISPSTTDLTGNNSDSIVESTVTGVTNETTVSVQTEVMRTLNASTTKAVLATTVPIAKVLATTVPIAKVLATTVPIAKVLATTVPIAKVLATTVPIAKVLATTVPIAKVLATTVPIAKVLATTVPIATVLATTVPIATVTQPQTTEIQAVLDIPIPYVSPGKYLVEYPYEYHFTIDEPENCKQQKPFLVLVVPVAPHNRAARDVIRSTWGGERLVLDKKVSLFFLLGLPGGVGKEAVQEQVLKESREHRDLLQGDFLDCYKNLTIKTMMMMEWLDSRCSGASYAMKIDSDMFLNTQKLMSLLLSAPALNYMTGLVAGRAVVLRNPRSKWYLPVELFPESHYPHYALGLGYVFSLDLPRKLVEASRHVKAVYIEDVYVGLCMRHLGIQPSNPPKWNLFNVSPVPYNRCAYSRLIATTTNPSTDLVWVWKDFKRPDPFC